MKIDPDLPPPALQPLAPQAPAAPSPDPSMFEAMLQEAAPRHSGQPVPKPPSPVERDEADRPRGLAPTATAPVTAQDPSGVRIEPVPGKAGRTDQPADRPVLKAEVPVSVRAEGAPTRPPVHATPTLQVTIVDSPTAPEAVRQALEEALARFDAPDPQALPEPKPDPHGATQPGRDRAFGFRELGVWGHGGGRGAEGHPARACGVEALSTKPPVVEPKPPQVDRPVRTEPFDASPRPERRLMRASHDAAAERPDRPPIQRAPRIPGVVASAVPAVAVEAMASEEGVNLPESGEGSAPPASTPEASTPVSVIVTGEDGSLQVLAAAAHLNPEAVARLRRLAESMAREFGLSLAGFSLNGEPVGLTAANKETPPWR